MPFGDGTGPLGLGPNGFGFGRGFGRGLGYCRRSYYGYPTYVNPPIFPGPLEVNPAINPFSPNNEQFILAELKRIDANLAILQQQKVNLEKILTEKKEPK